MSKITNYIYMFSKLIASFVLFCIVLILGYALYSSYNDIDKTSSDLENQFLNLQKKIDTNRSNLTALQKLTKEKIKIVNLISENLLSDEEKKIIMDLQKNNKLQIAQLNEIQEKINSILLNKEGSVNSSTDNSKYNDIKQIESIKNLILLKYKNGNVIFEELKFLESLAIGTSAEVFEKLYLLESKSFFGIKNLSKEFDLSIKKYVKKNFMSSNQNSVITFLLRYISVKPSNLSVYENNDLNTLNKAKKHFKAEEYLQSLNQLSYLDQDVDIFKKLNKQIKLYLDFNNTILRVF